MFAARHSVGVVSGTALRLSETSLFRNVSVRCLNLGGGTGGDIPDNKPLIIALQHIHGIGRTRAHQIMCQLSIGNKLAKDLTGREVYSLREELSKYIIGNELKKCVNKDIERLIGIQCYRGIRQMDGLPCRGQRTKTNARTRKGFGRKSNR